MSTKTPLPDPAAAATLAIDFHFDSYRQASEVTIYAKDHQGLFARLAGAMAVAGASIDSARIATLKNGMALDGFFIEDAAGGLFGWWRRRKAYQLKRQELESSTPK